VAEVLPWRSAQQERMMTSHIGMAIALAGWAMLFAALFMSMAYLRLRSPMWPPAGVARLPLTLPFVNTLVLLASSVTLSFGIRCVRHSDHRGLVGWLTATLVLGFGFLGMQSYHWWSVAQTGLRVDSNLYGAAFYMLTVFHALHVLSGLGVLVWLLVGALNRKFNNVVNTPLRVTAMFWHFVDAIWVFLFVTVYVI